MRALARRAISAPGGWPAHLALCALLLPRAVFLGEALFERDLHLDWYPRVHTLVATVRSGFLPLWDLSIGFGQPLLGDPSAQVLYPTTWLALLIPPWTLYTVFAVLHLSFTAVGMTLLARAAGLRQAAAVLAGAAWMLCGPMVSLVNLWQHFAGAAWMPWVVLAVHRAVRRPGLRSVLCLGTCLGLQVLAGSGDMVLLTAALSGAWLVAAGPEPSRSNVARAAAVLALGVALAALLSAGQWLPAVDLASRSVRRELPLDHLAQRSVPPPGLVQTFVPLDGSGRLAYAPAAQRALFDSNSLPLLGSLYLGPVTLALAVAALLAPRRRRLTLSLAGVVVLAAFVALGPHSPVHGILVRFMPGATHVRYPSKVMVAVALASALLAGLGLAAIRSHAASRRVAGAVAVGGGLILAAGAALHGPALRWAVAWGLLLDRPGADNDALVAAARLLAGAALATLAGTALLRAGRGAGGPGVATVVAACLVADLLLAHHDLNATAPPMLLVARPPVLSALDLRDRARSFFYDYRIAGDLSERHLGRAEPYAVAQPPAGVDPRPLSALAQRLYPVPPVAGTWDAEGSYELDLRGLQPLAQRGLTLALLQAEGTAYHSRLLRMGAVRNVVSLHERGLEDLVRGPTFHGLFPEPIRTWGVPGALPRAYRVGRARAIEGPAAIQALVEPGFEPASEVILSGAGAASATAAGGTGTVQIAELFGDRVRLETEAATPGIVVLVDAWDPGWRASIDGRATEVLRANGAFRAVAVPAGRHVVEMRYRPWPVLVGLSLSATGLVALVIGTGFLVRRRLTPASSTSSAGSRRASASGAGSPSASPPPARPAR